MRELRSLNLGFNRVNNLSAEMLKAYLSSSRATITELDLSSADVDDEECAHFMLAIEHNTRLTSLNLSHNLIGYVAPSDHFTSSVGLECLATL